METLCGCENFMLLFAAKGSSKANSTFFQGSSKVGVIGEASIDFQTMPRQLRSHWCPFHSRIQERKLCCTDIEDNETPKSNYKEHSLMSHLSNGDIDGTIKENSEDVPFNKIVSHVTEFNGNRRASNGSDITMSSSESSSGVESVQREPAGLVSSLRPQGPNSDAQTAVYEEHQRSHWGWLGNPAPEASTDDSSSTPRETFLQQHLEEASDIVIVRLRNLKLLLYPGKQRFLKNREILSLSSGSLAKDIGEKTREVGSKDQRDEDNDDEEQKALEELVKEHVNAKESYLLETIMDLRSEIEIYKRDKDELEMQMEQLALDYEIMKQENHEMAYKLEQSQLQEQLKMQYECTSSYATAHELEAQIENLENELKIQKKESADALVTINELEGQIENLENELKKRNKESADALSAINELEAHVKSLEEELEKQSQGFEADLETLMCSKVEQEQRAIRAEEALRKMRWQNANTAERLQEEFRRLSVQMASTFEANEKLATKAVAEANELRLQKSHLEEMIHKASEEHQSVKEDYESRLHQLANQVVLMTNQIEQMQSEIEDRALQLEHQKNHAKKLRGFSQTKF
ncbi:UNVERIFIED_CONTAM: hypothetical protein Scaly_2398500 [Sesamum calycinum]|uniref:Uncharacterized protein n=1 Tax=Sesamum calycinum TaxID=2727403 RepID=A0AAW2LYX1_9LAMI